MENNFSKMTQPEIYIDSLKNNPINNLYNNFIVTNKIILNYLYDDNGFILSNNKITLRFNIRVNEIHHADIEYTDTFIISFIPRKEHNNQTIVVKYISKDIYVIEYILYIIEELIKTEKALLNILFLSEDFLTEELTLDEFNLLA